LTEVVAGEVAEHIIVLTDAKKGSLRQIVEREGYQSLVVPAEVGGRFSVLSTVGLFPLAYAGIDIDQLLAGARDMDERLVSSPLTQNPSLLYAGLQFLAYQQGQPLSVLMPYATGLRGIAQWYRQLWAESLGKKFTQDGELTNSGPTPIAAVGATDQHSQVQLYTEGPYDKVITFIGVEEFSRSAVLPEEMDGLEELSYLQRLEFGELIETERQATAMALAANGRPNASILLPRLDEFSLGELIYFFEVATAYSGMLYNINTYDQPGVETGKQNMYALLHKPGFEALAKELEPWINPSKTYRA
jgi:glucose-6-phosphate isomerase